MLRTLKKIAHLGLLSEPLPVANDELRVREALQAEIARVFARAVNIMEDVTEYGGHASGSDSDATASN